MQQSKKPVTASLWFQLPMEDCSWVENSIVVEESCAGAFFCAIGWPRGTVGLQEGRAGGFKSQVVFRVRDPFEAYDGDDVPEDQRVTCSDRLPQAVFATEGSGARVTFDFEWRRNTKYSFVVVEVLVDGASNYTAFFCEGAGSSWHKIATVVCPWGEPGLHGIFTSIENATGNPASAHRVIAGPCRAADKDSQVAHCTEASYTASPNAGERVDAGTEARGFYLWLGGAASKTRVFGTPFTFSGTIEENSLVLPWTAESSSSLGKYPARTVYLRYDLPIKPAWVLNSMVVERLCPGTFFCVIGWARGYLGLQQRKGRDLQVIFCVWDGEEGTCMDIEDNPGRSGKKVPMAAASAGSQSAREPRAKLSPRQNSGGVAGVGSRILSAFRSSKDTDSQQQSESVVVTQNRLQSALKKKSSTAPPTPPKPGIGRVSRDSVDQDPAGLPVRFANVDDSPVVTCVDRLPASSCTTFGPTGRGARILLEFPWKPFLFYSFVVLEEQSGTRTEYTAHFHDGFAWVEIGKLSCPNSGPALSPTYSFIQDYGKESYNSDHRAVFGSFFYGKTMRSPPIEVTRAVFSASDDEVLDNIDSGPVSAGGALLSTGGSIVRSRPLNSGFEFTAVAQQSPVLPWGQLLENGAASTATATTKPNGVTAAGSGGNNNNNNLAVPNRPSDASSKTSPGRADPPAHPPSRVGADKKEQSSVIANIGVDPSKVGARSVIARFLFPFDTCLWVENTLFIEKTFPGTNFLPICWARGFVGFQHRKGGDHQVIFCVYDDHHGNDATVVPEAQRVLCSHKLPGVSSSRFGGKGTGMRLMYELNWKPSAQYTFVVAEVIARQRTYYSCYLHLHSGWLKVGTLVYPQGSPGLSEVHSSIEDYSGDGREQVHRAFFGPCRASSVDESVVIQSTEVIFSAGSGREDTIDGSPQGHGCVLSTGGDVFRTRPLNSSFVVAPSNDVPLNLPRFDQLESQPLKSPREGKPRNVSDLDDL